MRSKLLMTTMTIITLAAGTAMTGTAFAQSTNQGTSDPGQPGCKQGQSANCVPGAASDPSSTSPEGSGNGTNSGGTDNTGASGTNTSPGSGSGSGGSNGSNGSGN